MSGRRAYRGRIWPAVVVAVALGLRLWGIDWQLPAAIYFDEMKYVAWAGDAKDEAGAAVTDLRNPTFFHHLLRTTYAVAQAIRRDPSEQQTAVFELGLARVISAVLGALACLLTALAARTVVRAAGGAGWIASGRRPDGGGRPAEDDAGAGAGAGPVPLRHPRLGDEADWAGCAAGLFLALAPLHVHLSHYAVNDATASLFLAATLLFGSRALAYGRPVDLVLAGLLAGLAFSTKYSFAVGLVLPLAVLALPRRLRWPRTAPPVAGVGPPTAAPLEPPGPAIAARAAEPWRRTGVAALVGFGFVLGAAAGAPELVTSPTAVAAGVVEQARLGASRWNGQSEAPVWQLYAETVGYGLGWGVVLLAGAGVAGLARRWPGAALAQLAVPAACLAVMLRQELFFGRFALPLLPTLALLAGIGAVLLAGLGAGGTRRAPAAMAATTAGLALVITLAALVAPAVTTVRHNRLATTPDTRLLARQWLRERPEGTRVAAEVYGQPLVWAGSQAPRGYRLQRVSSFVDPAMVGRLACDETRYFMVVSLTAERELARRARNGPSGYDLLAREGEVAATFDPFRPGMSAPAHTDNTGIPFWYLDAYARPGPKITVYELRDVAAVCAAARGR